MKFNENQRKNEDRAHKGTKCYDFEEKTTKVRPGVAPNVHLYDLLDVLDLVDELHLCHPHAVL